MELTQDALLDLEALQETFLRSLVPALLQVQPGEMFAIFKVCGGRRQLVSGGERESLPARDR